MFKLCPTCSNSAAADAMFCSRCGVAIAHIEPLEKASGLIAERSAGVQHMPERPHRFDVSDDAEPSALAEPVADSAATPGLAQSIGAVAGALLRGALEGALSGGDCAHRGPTSFGEVFLTVDGNDVYAGTSRFGTRLYVIDGDALKRPSLFGEVLARLHGDQVRLGASSWGEVIAKIDGPEVYRGQTTWGQPIAYIRGARAMLGVAAAYHLLRG
jgi:hypothetical protein